MNIRKETFLCFFKDSKLGPISNPENLGNEPKVLENQAFTCIFPTMDSKIKPP